MAYATLAEFDVDLDTHRKIADVAGEEPINGLILHTAGSSPNDVYSLDVWESKEDSERFFAEHLMPAMQTLGIPGGPPLSFQEFDMPVVTRG